VNLTMSRSSEFEEPLSETGPAGMCEFLIGLPDVNVNGVGDWLGWLRIAITTRAARPGCSRCGAGAHRHGRVVVALIGDPNCFGFVDALGLDETSFCRQGRWRTQAWSTQIVDVGRGQLLDVVPGRSAAPLCEWFAEWLQVWRDWIRSATLNLSGPYRNVFDMMLPDATQVERAPFGGRINWTTKRGPLIPAGAL
jgi:transposase